MGACLCINQHHLTQSRCLSNEITLFLAASKLLSPRDRTRTCEMVDRLRNGTCGDVISVWLEVHGEMSMYDLASCGLEIRDSG